MPAIQTAVERGEEAGHSRRYVPMTVHHNGRLQAQVWDDQSEQLEKVYEQQGRFYHQELGRKADGTYKVYEARGELKRIAKAMLFGPHRDALVPEAIRARREASTGNGSGPQRVRRKK